MNFTRTLAIVPLLAMPLLAEGPRFGIEGQFSAIAANGDLNKMVKTGNLTGYNLGASLRIETAPEAGIRPYVNIFSIRGENGTGLEKPAPRHLNLGVDAFKDLGKLTFFGGIGIVKWKQDETTAVNFTDAGGKNNTGKGSKVAGRIGVEYAFTPKLHGIASYTQTEFNKLYQPSWFSFGVSYRFASF